MFTARVPYHGLVDWTATDVDHYAESLRTEHQPRSGWTVPGRTPACRSCADVWPCVAFQWAEQWSRSVTRAEASQLG